jgi:hypothetical protein
MCSHEGIYVPAFLSRSITTSANRVFVWIKCVWFGHWRDRDGKGLQSARGASIYKGLPRLSRAALIVLYGFLHPREPTILDNERVNDAFLDVVLYLPCMTFQHFQGSTSCAQGSMPTIAVYFRIPPPSDLAARADTYSSSLTHSAG